MRGCRRETESDVKLWERVNGATPSFVIAGYLGLLLFVADAFICCSTHSLRFPVPPVSAFTFFLVRCRMRRPTTVTTRTTLASKLTCCC